MKKELAALQETDREFLYQVPAMIALLIAGVDDELDAKELAAAERIARYRKTVPRHPILIPYYEVVNERIHDDIEKLRKEYPSLAEQRTPIIAAQLEKLNMIFMQLNRDLSSAFYQSFKSFARHIAEADGGILGFFTISPEERRWMQLSMVQDPAEL